MNITEYTKYRIDNDITLLPSLLKIFSMFQMRFCYDKEPDNQNDVNIIALRCNDCGKETGLYMNNMNTKYKYIITPFFLNTLLHHVDMSWIVETY